MNADLSVAPEIARLALPPVPVQAETTHPGAGPAQAGPASTGPASTGPALLRTVGYLAGDLADLAATRERWWDLVRFDHGGPLRIPVPAAPGAWLLVAPPDTVAHCDCRYATLLAGEAVETGARDTGARDTGFRPLRPGRVRVHGAGAGHLLRTAAPGFSVTLHSTASTVRSA